MPLRPPTSQPQLPPALGHRLQQQSPKGDLQTWEGLRVAGQQLDLRAADHLHADARIQDDLVAIGRHGQHALTREQRFRRRDPQPIVDLGVVLQQHLVLRAEVSDPFHHDGFGDRLFVLGGGTGRIEFRRDRRRNRNRIARQFGLALGDLAGQRGHGGFLAGATGTTPSLLGAAGILSGLMPSSNGARSPFTPGAGTLVAFSVSDGDKGVFWPVGVAGGVEGVLESPLPFAGAVFPGPWFVLDGVDSTATSGFQWPVRTRLPRGFRRPKDHNTTPAKQPARSNRTAVVSKLRLLGGSRRYSGTVGLGRPMCKAASSEAPSPEAPAPASSRLAAAAWAATCGS